MSGCINYRINTLKANCELVISICLFCSGDMFTEFIVLRREQSAEKKVDNSGLPHFFLPPMPQYLPLISTDAICTSDIQTLIPTQPSAAFVGGITLLKPTFFSLNNKLIDSCTNTTSAILISTQQMAQGRNVTKCFPDTAVSTQCRDMTMFQLL